MARDAGLQIQVLDGRYEANDPSVDGRWLQGFRRLQSLLEALSRGVLLKILCQVVEIIVVVFQGDALAIKPLFDTSAKLCNV